MPGEVAPFGEGKAEEREDPALLRQEVAAHDLWSSPAAQIYL